MKEFGLLSLYLFFLAATGTGTEPSLQLEPTRTIYRDKQDQYYPFQLEGSHWQISTQLAADSDQDSQ